MEDYVEDVIKAESDNIVMQSYDKEAANRYGAMMDGEAKAHLEDAKRMLAENLDINLIAKVTSLSIEEIQNLEKE